MDRKISRAIRSNLRRAFTMADAGRIQCKEQMRTLDHVWLYLDKDTHADTKLERFGGDAAVGRVVSYIRSNGTKDFAIDIAPYVPIR